MEQQAPWVHSCLSATELNKQHSARFSLPFSHALLLALARRVLFYRCVVGTDDAEKQNPFVCGLFSCCCCSLRFGTELNFVNSFLDSFNSVVAFALFLFGLFMLFVFFFFLYVSLCVSVCVRVFYVISALTLLSACLLLVYAAFIRF